jgi:hypothetical protein
MPATHEGFAVVQSALPGTTRAASYESAAVHRDGFGILEFLDVLLSSRRRRRGGTGKDRLCPRVRAKTAQGQCTGIVIGARLRQPEPGHGQS